MQAGCPQPAEPDTAIMRIAARGCVALADGSFWLYEYDKLGQVKSGKKDWSDWTPVAGQQFEYGFDDIGNRTGTKVGGDASGANLRSASYTANKLNQYSSRTVPGYVDVTGVALAGSTVTVNGPTPPVYRRTEYFRKELTAANTSLPVWQSVSVAATGETTVNGNVFVPQTPESYTYDLDGNVTADGRWTYTWDAENRLVKMVKNSPTIDLATAPTGASFQKLGFVYDALGRRIAKSYYTLSTDTTPFLTYRFLYDGWNLLAIVNAQSSLLASFTWGNDLSGSLQGAGGVGGLLITRDTALGTVNFAGYDGNANVMALVNAADGKVNAQYEYGPFGEPIRATGTMAKANPFRFSTKYQDNETDLLYYGYRFYSPNTGRWPNRDPIQENGGYNLYHFVANNPVSGVDLLGLALYAFDGTGNNDREVSKGKFTWVLVLYQGYGGEKLYEAGVGSSFGTRAIGGLTGLGGRARVEAAYRAFLRNYRSGDTDIDIIGFSRGAALAREFANMIYERGDGSGYHREMRGKIEVGSWGKPCKIPDIRFVGLFDTVGSFGIPGNHINIGYNLGLPPNVKVARQAVAADEQRYLFPLTPLGSGGDGQDFDETYFPGDHSDIGRGHGADTRDLSFAPLYYIWSEGIAAGVPFGPLPDFTFTGNTTPHDLSSGFPYSIFPKRPR